MPVAAIGSISAKSRQIADLPEQEKLGILRERFKSAITVESDWRREAKEDIEFYAGKQWSDSDVDTLRKTKRPCLTINKIRPLLNLLSGYQRLNRYDPEFLPRTADDLEKVKVAKGVTKYLLDTVEFDYVESNAALRSWITGRGWYHAYWKKDWFTGEQNIVIESVSPFEIYVDPECTKDDLSDAEFLCHARWVGKEKVKTTFPEASDWVESIVSRYDQSEEEMEFIGTEPLWYSVELQKARLVTMWYRHYETEKYWVLPDGTEITGKVEGMLDIVGEQKTRQKCSVRCATFIGDLLLEDIESPYRHGMFPYVLINSYWLGEGDAPAGIVRDLKDPQRELNKRRSQMTHLVNTMANRGWKVKKGTMTDNEKNRLETMGSTPGVVIEYQGDTAPQEFATDQIPSVFFQTDRQSTEDLREISGINEAMLGSSPASQSGRAKELDQRQAVTHITLLFDQMRSAKLRLMRQLWGRSGAPGLIPQFYDEPKMFRIIGENGQPQFVGVNQPVQTSVNPFTGQAVTDVLNDLSTFEFDIVITDTPATPSQRVAAFYALLEMAKVGIPVPPDMILEASDIPQKEDLKNRMMAAQSQAAQSQGIGGQPGMPAGQPGAPPMPPQGGPDQAQIRQIIEGMRG
jgi:hypothetical protein